MMKSSHRYLHSFCERPNIRFQTQLDGETPILVLRAHPITQAGWIFTALALSVLPLFFAPFLSEVLAPLQSLFIIFFWYAFVFSYTILNIFNWVYNVGIVTNKRLIDIDYNGFMYREFSAAGISKVEEVTVKTGGFIPAIFNFGNVFVQTAGEEQNIEYLKVPDPNHAAKIINDLVHPS